MSSPVPRPADERLRREVQDALQRSEPIRALDMRTISVEAREGVVVMRGIVASETHRFVAEQLARRVPRVKEVVNELATDEGLERSIGSALASRGLTRKHRIAVNVVGGVASLYGAVPSEEDAEAVRAAACAVQGVLGVESRLQVVPPGTTVVLAWQSSIEGRPLPLTKDGSAEQKPGGAGEPSPRAIEASPHSGKASGAEGAATEGRQ